ncbi:polysaccharide pyruvyl transferase family protein [Clostridium sp. JS66]|uniref:polysaccharide pyruvyl transferase family protein n=1 Tax=Clostridium sp. JS66 TaxID=3064705 RepID=UPI00298DA4D1|nr:polysaccharide pyruvyl transferase family protein [Clostridium sp. JS66]WPC43288.1 polysaccharide pyruvyl transferase family protein [Clostridium sp. JS66]
MEKQLKIGLFGIYGLYNYGCEAIVRGTYELLKLAWPNCKIILYTYCPKEDRKAVSDLNIIVKYIPMKRYIMLRRIINKFLRIIFVQKQLTFWNAKSVANECDIIFSIGGDIYTIPKNIIDKNKETKHSDIVEFGKTILQYKPLVIWGASIGPFGEKEGIKNYYFNHLKDVKQIFCREKTTFNYLKSNNIISNLSLCSDPAFYIKDIGRHENFLKSNKIKIALNLSPLSIREQIGKISVSFKKQIINTIKKLITIPNTEIVLVPHVISPLSDKDNDMIYLKDIYNSIPRDYIKSVSLLESGKGFLGTKEFLKKCDIVIAARMHCAINAICEGIPTIFLFYSQKGLGMANYIYGNSEWAIPLVEMEKELKDKTLEMLNNKEIISKKIKNRIEEIQSDEQRIVNLFKKLT